MSDFQIIPEELLALASPAERRAYAAALQRHLALRTPLDFALAVRPEAVDYPHTRLIAEAIAEIPPWGGLIVTMPPRHGKSYLVSETTPAWLLARDPNARILHATYGHEYTASKLSPVVHELVKANAPLTPKMHTRRSAIADFMVDPKVGSGFYFGTGVGGPMTGMPADWLILDDLVKNWDDAKSALVRQNIWRWYTTVAERRLEPGGRTIAVGTPWHEDDPISRMIAYYKDNPDWRVIRLPALAEEDDEMGRAPGEALCPERYPADRLKEKQRLDPPGYAAQFQGRPSPEEGDVFKADNLVEYDPATLVEDDRPVAGTRFATVDLAHSTKERADYSVITCWHATPAPNPGLHATHMFRDKVDSGEHLAWFDRCMTSIPKAFRPVYAVVENKTFGSTMLSTARTAGRRGKVPLRPGEADKDKHTRAQPAATISTQGQLRFPAGGIWVPDAKHELLMFPNGTHDDIVDTVSLAAIEFLKHPGRTPKAQGEGRPKTVAEKAAAQIRSRAKKAKAPNRRSLMHA